MLRLLFTFERELILFDINNKEIRYYDRKWPKGVRFIPKDEGLVKMILFSRNKYNYKIIEWINEANSGQSLEEWKACKDDQEVAEYVKKDAKLRGAVFQKQFSEEELKVQQANGLDPLKALNNRVQ